MMYLEFLHREEKRTANKSIFTDEDRRYLDFIRKRIAMGEGKTMIVKTAYINEAHEMNSTAELALDTIEAMADRAEAEGRDFNQAEEAKYRQLKQVVEKSNMNIQTRSNTVTTFKRVPPASIGSNTRSYSLMGLIRHVLDPSFDAGYEIEIAQELRRASPWIGDVRGMEGTPVPLEALIGVSKAGSTNPGGSLEPLLGVDYRDELTRLDGAITRATLSDKLGARVLTGLVERDVSFPRQTGQMSAGHVAIDSDLPTAADPAFNRVSLTPKLVGGVYTLNLSAVFAEHPRAGTPEWVSAELRRALTVEIDRVMLSGNNTTNPEEPDGLAQQGTPATQASVSVGTNSIDELNALKHEMSTYLQVEDMMMRTRLIHHPKFMSALESVPSFAGSGMSVASDIKSGAAARMGYTEAEILPVTPGTPDTAPGYLVADPQTIVHGFWSTASVVVNPYADSVFASGGTLVRIMLMHDFLCLDPKRVLQTTIDLEQ